MNETNMELQAIRQKLQSLKAEPLADETLAIPWSSPRQQPPKLSRPTSKLGPDLAQVDAAIKTLKQRSSQTYGSQGEPSSYGDRPERESLDAALQRFESQLQTVNTLAAQQESAILGLKQLADHILADPTRFHQQAGAVYSELGAIATFFDAYRSAAIPTIERDDVGNYGLGYHNVDFDQAERDAQVTAQTLRSLGSEQPHHYSPQADQPNFFNNQPGKPTGFFEEGWLFLQSLWELALTRLSSIFGTPLPSRRKPRSRFTLLDAAIWFSGAAIMRILLDVIFQLYPALWTPLVVILIGVVAITLYRTLLSSRPSVGFSYRILVALVGLLIGGQFL